MGTIANWYDFFGAYYVDCRYLEHCAGSSALFGLFPARVIRQLRKKGGTHLIRLNPASRTTFSHFTTSAFCISPKDPGYRRQDPLPVPARRLLDIGLLQNLRDLGVQAIHNRFRGAGRRKNRLPRRDLEPRNAAFGRRRDVGHATDALRGSHRKGSQLTRLHMRSDNQRRIEHQWHVAGYDVSDGGPAALYGTCSILTWAFSFRSSPARCGEVPPPADANVRSPGFAFAAAMTSCSDLYGVAAPVTRTRGLVPGRKRAQTTSPHRKEASGKRSR